MRILSLISFVLFLCQFSIAQVHVKGYTRSNGTYVQPHYRSSPDGNPYNNWSYPGNTNPYTGKTATGNASTYLENYNNERSNSSSNRTYTNNNKPSYNYPSVGPQLSSITYENKKEKKSTRTRTIIVAKLKATPNVRDLNYKEVPEGSYVTLIDKTEDFWKVEYEGITGYINEVYLSANYELTSISENDYANFMTLPSTTVTANISGSLRLGPDTKYAELKRIKKGDKLTLIGRVGPYLKVSSNSTVGYINEVLLNLNNTLKYSSEMNSVLVASNKLLRSDLPERSQIPDSGIMTTVRMKAFLRDGPDVWYKVVATIPNHTNIEVLSVKKGYYLVRYKKSVGYLNDVFLNDIDFIRQRIKTTD